MAGIVVCLAGRIGSGKSSVSRRLAAALGWRRVAFGDYVRDELARRGGDPTSREALQDLGQALVDADPNGFCAAVLAAAGFEPGGDLVLDGVRHVAIQRAVSELAQPSVARLLYLSADEAERLVRVAARDHGESDLARADAHRVEADLRTSLLTVADRVIDASAPLDRVVADCLAALQAFGVDPAQIALAANRDGATTRGG